MLRHSPVKSPSYSFPSRLVLFIFYITEFRILASELSDMAAYTWYERGWEVSSTNKSYTGIINLKPMIQCVRIPVSLDALEAGVSLGDNLIPR